MCYTTETVSAKAINTIHLLRMQIQDAELDVRESSGNEMGAFEPEIYHQALQTSKYGRLLLSTRSIPSTQLIMLQNRKVMPHGAPLKSFCNTMYHINSRVVHDMHVPLSSA